VTLTIQIRHRHQARDDPSFGGQATTGREGRVTQEELLEVLEGESARAILDRCEERSWIDEPELQAFGAERELAPAEIDQLTCVLERIRAVVAREVNAFLAARAEKLQQEDLEHLRGLGQLVDAVRDVGAAEPDRRAHAPMGFPVAAPTAPAEREELAEGGCPVARGT
jgi:hypothetical protein